MPASIDISMILAGLFDFGLFLFHLFFWRIFRWRTELRAVSPINRAVMQVMNLSLMVVFLFFGYLVFFRSAELIATPFGVTVLGGIAVFWFARAVMHPILFGYKTAIANSFTALFLAGAALHGYPAIAILATRPMP